jgi:hypothetical protein
VTPSRQSPFYTHVPSLFYFTIIIITIIILDQQSTYVLNNVLSLVLCNHGVCIYGFNQA